MPTANPRGRQLLVALPTLFADDGALDLDASAEAAALVAGSRADGAFVAGTTGEFLALSREERLALFETQLRALAPKRLIAHIGAGSTAEAIALLRGAAALGATEFAALTPLYLPGTPTSTLAHFRAISEVAQELGARVYVYLFEARTTTHVTPEELAVIADLPGIVGTKISGYDLETVLRYRAATRPEFEVFTGNDADFPSIGAAGIDGVVSGVASCFPDTFDEMIDALGSEDQARIAAAHARVLRAVDAIQGDIARIKFVLSERGIGGTALRWAIDQPDDERRRDLRAVIEEEHR
ncbi:MAG: dihydrodipicolinate synthase family protein [Arachnia sp.]